MQKTQDSLSLTWALPESMNIPVDKLRYRVDIFEEAILLHQFGENGATSTRPVSAHDIARAFAREMRFASGVLPEGALWWSLGPEGEEVALWRPPRVWKAALVLEAFQPPRRFSLPMPGLVFVCSPGRPPRVYAAKKRPASPGSPLCKAPLFNLLGGERACSGTHRWPDRVEEVPESLFQAFFTREGEVRSRSRKHPQDLLALWEEINGKKYFPVRDLLPCCTVEEAMGKKGEMT